MKIELNYGKSDLSRIIFIILAIFGIVVFIINFFSANFFGKILSFLIVIILSFCMVKLVKKIGKDNLDVIEVKDCKILN